MTTIQFTTPEWENAQIAIDGKKYYSIQSFFLDVKDGVTTCSMAIGIIDLRNIYMGSGRFHIDLLTHSGVKLNGENTSSKYFSPLLLRLEWCEFSSLSLRSDFKKELSPIQFVISYKSQNMKIITNQMEIIKTLEVEDSVVEEFNKLSFPNKVAIKAKSGLIIYFDEPINSQLAE